MNDVERLREAIRLTREYVGEPMLPAIPGWSWFDAIAATGGFEGFGACGCVLDPQVHGRTANGELRYCDLPAAHEGDHGRADRNDDPVSVRAGTVSAVDRRVAAAAAFSTKPKVIRIPANETGSPARSEGAGSDQRRGLNRRSAPRA